MSCSRDDFWKNVASCKQEWRYHGKGDSPEESDEDGQSSGSDDPTHQAQNQSQSVDVDVKVRLPMASFKHAALPDARSYIRILELQAGQGHELIVCQLKEMVVNESRNKYDALSYVWGEPGKKPKIIQVDGKKFEIGANLYRALRCLRHADRSHFLWVDAICIDQWNMAERNNQIPLMCEIYQNAACTVCFLGRANKSTRDTFNMLVELAQERRTLEEKYSPTHPRDAMDAMIPVYANDLPVMPVKTELSEKYAGDGTIVSLASNEWWHRIWTVQELVLSSNAVLMIGRYTIAWEDLRDGVNHGFSTHIWGHITSGFQTDEVTIPYISIRALMERYRRSTQLSSPTDDLLHILIHCRHRDAKDPRDKIYAVLGLLQAMHPVGKRYETSASETLRIVPDYDSDVVDVYRTICQELIEKGKTLDVLGVCPESSLPGLPSWATDWSITERIGSPLMHDSLEEARNTHAAKHTDANARFFHDRASMIISGHQLTSVVKLAEDLPSPVSKITSAAVSVMPTFRQLSLEIPKTSWKLYRYWLKSKIIMICIRNGLVYLSSLLTMDIMHIISVFNVLFAWELFAALQTSTNSGGKPDTIYWQTICAGTYKNDSVEETGMLFKTWSTLFQPMRKIMKNNPAYAPNHPFLWGIKYYITTWQSYGELWPYISCSHHRRLAWAANGWLCLLPKHTQIGDVIILAKGGRVPLVIRWHKEGYCTFVGEAYVHGIMDGEAFDEGKCVDIEMR